MGVAIHDTSAFSGVCYLLFSSMFILLQANQSSYSSQISQLVSPPALSTDGLSFIYLYIYL